MTPKKGIGFKRKQHQPSNSLCQRFNQQNKGCEKQVNKNIESKVEVSATTPLRGFGKNREGNQRKRKAYCSFDSSSRNSSSPQLVEESNIEEDSEPENCFCATKRHRESLASSTFIEIGEETSKGGFSLTTEGLGMKIGAALKNAIPLLADRKVLMSSLTAAFGIQNDVEVGNVSPLSQLDNNTTVAPFVTTINPVMQAVNFDSEIFFTALQDGITPVPGSTASTHKFRARNDVNAALNRHGTLEHQAAIIHDICTVGPKAGIGVALGILENPEKHESVVKNLFQDTFEVLHCDRVLGRNNTQAIEFTHNTFLATAPTAPAEHATAKERKSEYRKKVIEYCNELQLTDRMRKKAQNAGIRRREILYADDTQESLTYEWKRKSPRDKKLTPGMIEAVQEWLFSSC
jgi:hypothetical protein